MEKCFYDYADKCDCSEDDKCGCTYPNNMPHNFSCKNEPPEKDEVADNLSVLPEKETALRQTESVMPPVLKKTPQSCADTEQALS